jgi:hypothetical protein
VADQGGDILNDSIREGRQHPRGHHAKLDSVGGQPRPGILTR